MGWTIGVDVGGTFTDFFALDEAGGEVWLHKRPSTPDDPGRAIVEGIEAFARRPGRSGAKVRRLAHGTTVATNALIQRRGGKVALVVTEGFRDLIEIGRQIRPHVFNLQDDYPGAAGAARTAASRRPSASPRTARRMRAARPRRRCRALIEAIGDAKPDACAVCLLFSFLNPAHEAMIARALQRGLPDLYLSLSSEVQPEFREYERLLDHGAERLSAAGDGPLSRPTSQPASRSGSRRGRASASTSRRGGLMSVARARQMPIRTALSGPAAGAVGAIHMARLSGVPDVITLDMGGTSADVALIRNCTRRRSRFNKWSRAIRRGSPRSTSHRSAPAAARSPGSTATG